MQERAGVVLPAEREVPRMDPPNVLWFAGTYSIAFAAYGLVASLPSSHNSLWIFLVSLALLLAFAAASRLLLRAGWWVPGGLAAALAVGMVPGVSVGFLLLIDAWPDDLADPFSNFNGWTLGVSVATAVAGLIAFWLTRFSFLFAIVVGAILAGSEFLPATFAEGLSGKNRATTALVTGSLLVIAGVFLDVFGRRRDAFWFHALGWLTVAGGLFYYAIGASGEQDRGWVPMLIVGVLMVIVSGFIRRATWAVYGVLGYFAALEHYLSKGLDENNWSFALSLLGVGLSIFVFGMLLHRYGKSWSERFIRRPPPFAS